MGVEVCPIHKAEFKSSSIHVGAMSYPSQPKGLKRKYSDDEEEDEPPRTMGLMHIYPRKRMELLDITYDKIKKTQAEKNPTLERQVLLTNVVRSLRDSFEKDGIQVNGLTRDSPAPVWSNINNQVSNLDPPPTPNNGDASFCGNYMSQGTDRPATPAVISPMTPSDYGNYSSEHCRCVMDFDDMPRAPTPFSRSGYERLEPGALWTDDNDRLTCLNWSSVLKSTDMDISSSCSSECSVLDDSGSGTSLHILMPAVTGIEAYLNSSGVFSASSSPNVSSMSGSTSPASGSSPTSSEDEIFGDLDITLYDYDYTPLSPPNVAMTPLTAEELMWSLSNDQKPVNPDDRDYLASVRT